MGRDAGVSPARARTSYDDIVAAGRESSRPAAPTRSRCSRSRTAWASELPPCTSGCRSWGPDRRDRRRGAKDLADELEPLDQRSGSRRAPSGSRSAFRAFAQRNPRAYELLFMNLPAGSRPPAERPLAASEPLLRRDRSARRSGARAGGRTARDRVRARLRVDGDHRRFSPRWRRRRGLSLRGRCPRGRTDRCAG